MTIHRTASHRLKSTRIRLLALPIVAGAVAAGLFIAGVGGASGATSPISAATQAGGFTKQQVYTFPGSTVPSQWSVYSSSGTSTSDSRVPSYVSVSGGYLHVKASGDQGSGLCLCAGGGLSTPAYGRWDIYARVPVDAHHNFGMLLWPNNGLPKAGQEIDIAEFPGPDKTVLQNTVHDGPGENKHSHFTNGNYSTFHKYSVVWTKSSLSFWVDDKKVWDADPSYSPVDPMHLVLQGGIYSQSTPTSGTSEMDVKSVRYFHN